MFKKPTMQHYASQQKQMPILPTEEMYCCRHVQRW